MPNADQNKPSRANDVVEFDTTHWSVVLAAGDARSSASNRALATLCQAYWYPLYAYARRRGLRAAEAQDLTQEFFATLLEKKSLAAAKPERGRFRAFLLVSFKNFLANEWDKAKAEKRGGGRTPIPLDVVAGESRYASEPADELTPERIYERQWVITLLDHVLSRLREEYVAVGKESYFEQLKAFIAGQAESGAYAEAARQLEMTEGAARVATHRLRRRYRNLLRTEIAQTVAGPGEVDDEIRNLFAILGKAS